ncbi:unnamed protein product, partial [Aureobasidium pullulans]
DDDHIDDQWDAVVAAAASLGGYFDTTQVHEADHIALEHGGRKRSLEADLLRKRARRLLSRTFQKFARKERYRFITLTLRTDSYPHSSTPQRTIRVWKLTTQPESN